MQEKKTTISFKILKTLINIFYPKITVEGLENIVDEPCIIVANHCQLHGPVICELQFPIHKMIWCNGEMMVAKEVPAYTYKDFWSRKPKYIRWFYKILSYLITPFSVCIFNNAHTIAVRRDGRIVNTFKETLKYLKEGYNIVIFPEEDIPYNNILYSFQNKFIQIAKLYYKQSNKCLNFVPAYISPTLKKMVIGKPITYVSENDMEFERNRISDYLMNEICQMAYDLPKHKVVPYRNVSKKEYPTNERETK